MLKSHVRITLHLGVTLLNKNVHKTLSTDEKIIELKHMLLTVLDINIYYARPLTQWNSQHYMHSYVLTQVQPLDQLKTSISLVLNSITLLLLNQFQEFKGQFYL